MTGPTKPDRACKGAWCQIRDTCPAYTAAKRRRDDAERLCVPGEDGTRKAARRPAMSQQERERQIVAILSAADFGVSSRDIARRLGITKGAAMWHLSRMRAAGICGATGSKYTAVWAMPDRLDAAREHAQAAADALITDETRRRRERKLLAACTEGQECDAPDMPVRQSTVPAISAPRLPIGTMITSIFSLAVAS